jgi:sulfate adenylyltransferase large subunit
MDERALIESDILGYLETHQAKELLRFTTVGSVDDGKSTLIGRLLYDAHGLYEDQLRAVERASSAKSDTIDLSLVTDGLKAEREQGITIDVAYRYFSTDKRKFIIADTPGHVQYTRNMATGASTANVAIILIDARLGVLQQSRRHAFIASLLGIPHLTVCINKMDLRDYDQGVYEGIRKIFSDFAAPLRFKDITFIPISALKGDNIVKRSDRTPWFGDKTLLEHLETVPIADDRNYENFRYPVQYVLRPNLDYRGFAGEIAAGVVRRGDRVMVLPSRKTSRVKAIDTFGGEIESAYAPMSVTLRLEDEVDVSRGDMLVLPDDLPTVAQRFEAHVVWMNERPLDRDKSYFLKHTTRVVRAEIETVLGHVDLETLAEIPADGLALNDIGRALIRTHRPIFFDPYQLSRTTGAFILIDSLSNDTVAAGMILGVEQDAKSLRSAGAHSQVSPVERRERLGQSGAIVWIAEGEGDPVELAYAIERRLFDLGRVSLVLATTPEAKLEPAVLREIARRAAAAGMIVVVAGEPDGGPSGAAEFAQTFIQVKYGAPTGDGRDPSNGPVMLKTGEDVEQSAVRVSRALEFRHVFV